ncbi:MAG: GtrA family protein [Actinomycetes bacterium]
MSKLTPGPIDQPGTPRVDTGRTHQQAVRFLLVGGLSYVVDVSVLWAVVTLGGWALVVGTTAAFAAAFVVNYGLGRVWVFRAAGAHGPQVARYSALVALNYALTLVFMTSLTGFGVGLVIAKTISVAILAVLNFFVGRHWVYR